MFRRKLLTPVTLALGCLLFSSFALEARSAHRRPASQSFAAGWAQTIEFDRVEGDTVHFKVPEGVAAPKSLKTELHELKYLGILRPIPGDNLAPPYFLFIGRPCSPCQQESGIYAIQPSGGKPSGFVHPGRIFDPKTRALVMESRAFLGHCLPRYGGSVYVVFQKERVDRRKQLQASVLIAEAGPDHIRERLLETGLPRLKDTLQLVKQKGCQEISGRNRVTLSRPPVDRRRAAPDSDGDDDDDPSAGR